MYRNYEPKCAICKKAKPTCGDPKIYCKECSDALLTGRVRKPGSENLNVGREKPVVVFSDIEHCRTHDIYD